MSEAAGAVPGARPAELGHIADLLRDDPVTHDRDGLDKLGLRLPGLADSVDTITRQVVQRGALLARMPAAHSAAFGTVASTWTIAARTDAAVEALLDGLEQAGAVPSGDGLTGSQVRLAFPPLRGVRAGGSGGRPDDMQTASLVRSRRR